MTRATHTSVGEVHEVVRVAVWHLGPRLQFHLACGDDVTLGRHRDWRPTYEDVTCSRCLDAGGDVIPVREGDDG